jgi:glycine/D-amino acid oxidase-like deaminating enzyme
MLAHFLLKKGKKICIIDNRHQSSSSKVAAGIINPITGRRYVKSWIFEELYDFALETYRELEEKFDIEIVEHRNILRVLANHQEVNDYYARSGQDGYGKFMIESTDNDGYDAVFKPFFDSGEVQFSGKANMNILLEKYQEYFIEKGILNTEQFDFQYLNVSEEGIFYKMIAAKKVIFCEGYKAIQNPFFGYLPFRLMKGEVLIIRIPNFKPTKIFKHKLFFVPIKADLFWVGATTELNFENEDVSEAGKAELLRKVEQALKVPFEVVEAQAGVRPTVFDRRPFLGNHSVFRNLFIYNGLGTKGSTLAPFFAQHLAAVLEGETQLMAEVNIRRFDEKVF